MYCKNSSYLVRDVTCTCGISFCFSCGQNPHSPASCDCAARWKELEYTRNKELMEKSNNKNGRKKNNNQHNHNNNNNNINNGVMGMYMVAKYTLYVQNTKFQYKNIMDAII